MRFRMIDEITELVPGSKITAVKRLSASEDYLRDHFPDFPVMPGVLMLEALFQASMWLVLSTNDFSHPLLRMRDAKNIKFADFVKPGQTLQVVCELTKQDHELITLTCQGTVEGATAVNGRLVLEQIDVAERFPTRVGMQAYCRRELRQQFDELMSAATRA